MLVTRERRSAILAMRLAISSPSQTKSSKFFPMSSFGSVTGALWVTWAWGGALGTYLLGLSFDITHSYGTAIVGFVAVLAAGAIAILRIGPYAFPPHQQEARTTLASAEDASALNDASA